MFPGTKGGIMKYRRFQVGMLRFLPENSQSLFKGIFAAHPDHVDAVKNWMFFRSENGKTLLRVEKRNNNSYCVLFKSSEFINNYYFDNLSYSEENVEKRAGKDEKVVTAFRFIVIDMADKERVIYEEVRTPRFSDVNSVLHFKGVSDGPLSVIPSLKVSSLSKIPKMYRIEWEFEQINDGKKGKIFSITNGSKGKLVSIKKNGLFSISLRNNKYVVTMNDDPDADVQSLPFGSDVEYKSLIGKFKDNTGAATVCNLNDLTLRKYVSLDESEINDHDAIFERLVQFYLECEDVSGIIGAGE
jgi:hypothetical protein